ncbi:MAG TPA: hypothetical protein VGG39_17085 [Polyangiaceae bacterium]
MLARAASSRSRLAGPRAAIALACTVALSAACATLDGTSNDGVNLPSAGDGPFRPLVGAELAVGAVPPYVFGVQAQAYEQPSAVGVNDDPSSAEVWMYCVAHPKGGAVIVRTHALDGRSFYGDATDNEDTSHPAHAAPTVLSADQAWEGGTVTAPSALRANGQVWLYYAGAGGIGVAQSSDGLSFTKVPQPVLTPDATATWETSTPGAPSVAVFPDGTWHMLYAAGGAIGEATSPDGLTWTRADGNPILAPSPTVDPSTLGPGETPPFDEGSVDDPVLAPQTTFDGRFQVRVLYTGYLEAPGGTAVRDSAIGVAGRFGTSGPLTRQAAPTYTAKLHERAAAFFEYAGGSLLYVGEDDTSLSSTSPFPGIAGAYAPATETLPPPSAFADSP